MADLTDRMSFEARFARGLSRLTTKQRHELRDKLGSPPDYSRITQDDWDRWQRERRNRLLLFLLLIGLTSAEQHAEEVEADHPQAGDLTTPARRFARDWAFKRASDLAVEQMQRTRDDLRERSREWERDGDVPQDLVDADLVDVMGPRRDANTAATETTAGNSAGINGTHQAAKSAGVPMVLRWFTQADDRVCPVCGPLHRKVSDLWELVVSNARSASRIDALAQIRANNGPPAHPNCRCHVELVEMRKPIGAFTEAHKPGWKKVGGSSVHVNADGRIDKGCPGLKGEYVEDLIDEPQHSRDRREARQAKAKAQGLTGHDVNMQQAKRLEGDQKERDAFEEVKKAAKRHGVTPDEIIARIPDVIEARKDADSIRIEAKRAAHKMTGLSPSDLHKMENRYKDASHAAAFDTVLDELRNEHPEYGIETESDLWDLLKQDHRPRAEVHHPDVIDEAAAMAADHRARRPSKRAEPVHQPAEEPNPWAEVW